MSLSDQILRTHQWIYQNTDGIIGHRLLFGSPTLLLHSTGRRSGLPRTNALIYARDGEVYLVVASNGGSSTPPGWLANVKANPDCEIQVGRQRQPVTARPMLPGDPGYARRWAIADEVNNGRYTEYQSNTDRTIPIVELRPTTPSESARSK
jgi:deazaflavin-dependent oxidoreductase (nitroreductase family)